LDGGVDERVTFGPAPDGLRLADSDFEPLSALGLVVFAGEGSSTTTEIASRIGVCGECSLDPASSSGIEGSKELGLKEELREELIEVEIGQWFTTSVLVKDFLSGSGSFDGPCISCTGFVVELVSPALLDDPFDCLRIEEGWG